LFSLALNFNLIKDDNKNWRLEANDKEQLAFKDTERTKGWTCKNKDNDIKLVFNESLKRSKISADYSPKLRTYIFF